jgi:hypothetical protein
MDDHRYAPDNAFDQTEQQLLIFTISDEQLEKAAGGTTWAQTYPSTCVATWLEPTEATASAATPATSRYSP